MMTTTNFTRTLIGLITVLISSVLLFAEDSRYSQSQHIGWQVIAEGSTVATSHGYRLLGTTGQAISGKISSGSRSLSQGFWVPADSNACALCGDADGNNVFTISDAVYLINYIFAGGYPPLPFCRGDADGNDFISVSDVVHLLNYIFAGGPTPHCPL